MGYLLIHYNIDTDERVRVGYRNLYSPSSPYIYLSRYLLPSESPYSIEVSDGVYTVEITPVGSCGDLGCPRYYASITHTNNNSSGGGDTTTTSTTTSTTTVAPFFPSVVDWGIFISDPGYLPSVTLSKSINIIPGSNYTIPTSTTSGLYYYVIRELASEPVKTKYYNTDSNHGIIPDQMWKEPIIMDIYRYYESNGLVSFNTLNDTTFST